MAISRVWTVIRSRTLVASLFAGALLSCGDPVSIRGDKSILVLLALLASLALLTAPRPSLARSS